MMKLIRKNNKGIAMITIIITVAFLSIIATALLSISYSNYRMKLVNQNSKVNFYDTEKSLNVVAASVRSKVKGSTTPDTTLGSDLGVLTTTTTPATSTYSMDKVGEILKTAYGSSAVENYAKDGDGRKRVSYTVKNADGTKDYFILSTSGNNNYKIEDKNTPGTDITLDNLKRVTIKDINIEQFSNVSLTNTGAVDFESPYLTKSYEYNNKIKTDIVCMYEEGTASSGGSAGVGDFSILCDSPISMGAGSGDVMSTLLYFYGNAFFASMGTTSEQSVNTYDADGNANGTKQCWVTSPSTTTAALSLTTHNRVVCKGDYAISYGKIVLGSNSVLVVDCPNFYVYGDIELNDKSALICTGNIYMPSSNSIKKNSTNASIIPTTLTKKQIKDKDIIAFQEKIGCCDPKTTYTSAANAKKNDGIIPQICQKTNNFTWWEDNWANPNVTSGSYTNSYGRSCKVLFYQEGNNTTGTLNTNSRFTLSFLSPKFNKLLVRESQSFATLMTHKTQVEFEMNHDIVLTNVGNDAFNEFISESKKNSYYVTMDGGVKYYIHDLFKDNPDTIVSNIIGSLGGSTSTSASTPPQTKVGFTSWAKDFE